jgi:diphosphomevalonate decarboxylase
MDFPVNLGSHRARKMRITARAPSNIALIKYMGKTDAGLNRPLNGSISLTLNHLCTVVEVTTSQDSSNSANERMGAQWFNELPSFKTDIGALEVPKLSDAGIARVYRHIQRMRNKVPEILPRYGLKIVSYRDFEIRSANTFATATGIASSASSFAAITLATAAGHASDPEAFIRSYKNEPELRCALAEVSRQGSGSSCRSFGGPWVLWEDESATVLSTRMPAMTDFVLVVSRRPKLVSSSDAHQLVRTSPLWDKRAERVASRIAELEAALGKGDLRAVARVAWTEMWEMHSMFHTCAEPFTYWEPGSIQALNLLAPLVNNVLLSKSDRSPIGTPIVTMDAGANVHVLVPTAKAPEWRVMLKDNFPNWEILEDGQGDGAAIVDLERVAEGQR